MKFIRPRKLCAGMSEGRRFPEFRHETHVSAQQNETKKKARLSQPHEHKPREGDPPKKEKKRPDQADRLR